MNKKPQNICLSKMKNSSNLDKTGWPVEIWLKWNVLHHFTSDDEKESFKMKVVMLLEMDRAHPDFTT